MKAAARWLVIAAALGLLHALAFAPWGRWWLALLVLAAFSAIVRTQVAGDAGVGRAAAAGLLFGFGWFFAGVGWLYVSMHTYGAMAAPLAALALALFAGYLALFPAAAAALVGLLTRRTANAPATAAARAASPASAAFPIAFAAAMTLAELGRGLLFTGFPWLAIGYSQVGGPLAGYAAVGGVFAVGFAACLVAALGASGVTSRRPWPWLAAAAVLLAGAGLATQTWSEPAGAPITVRLVQGNVPQQMKFEAATVQQTMRRYVEQIEMEPADLVVLPETAWTMPWPSTPVEVAERLERFVATTGSAVAIGMPLIVPPAGGAAGARPTLSNSVLLFDRAVFAGSAPPARYDKRHLVPFGEFVPWGFRWFVDLMTIPLGDFARGTPDQPPFEVAGQRIAFNICYEDVFGEELLPSLHGPDGATILANVSNIAWFGDSHAPAQHRQIARMRALETARPMIRATNTGVTAAIDHDGTVLAELPGFHAGALRVTVQGRRGLTPYARAGNLPIALLSLAGVALAGGLGRRGARPQRQTR